MDVGVRETAIIFVGRAAMCSIVYCGMLPAACRANEVSGVLAFDAHFCLDCALAFVCAVSEYETFFFLLLRLRDAIN